MLSFFNPFLIAMQFLTRLPVSFLLELNPSQDELYSADNQARSLKYYPLVGLIIGLLLVAAIFILNTIAATHILYIAGLVVFLWVVLSGGLHLDGVADMADAWMGGLGDKDKTLRIMKDPVSGPFGVIAIIFTIVLKLIFIYELININYYLILLPPLLSRAAVVILLMSFPYARPQGMGSDLQAAPHKVKNTISVILFMAMGLYLLLLFSNMGVLLGVGGVGILFYMLFTRNVIKRIGGVTGDIAGAFIEYMELIILFSLVTFTFVVTKL